MASSAGVRWRKMFPRQQVFDARPAAVPASAALVPVVGGFRRPVTEPVEVADDPLSDDIESGLAPSRLELVEVRLSAGRCEDTSPFARDTTSDLEGRLGVRPRLL